MNNAPPTAKYHWNLLAICQTDKHFWKTRVIQGNAFFPFPINLMVLKYQLPHSSKVYSLSVWQPTPSP